MAVAKNISDLNNAGPLNSGDYLPLSQSGQSEAVRTTVGDLAAAVGELNETGALSELSLATSMGKNALAQAIKNKGIECTPQNTLLEMANKINLLPIANTDFVFYQGKVYYPGTNPTYTQKIRRTMSGRYFWADTTVCGISPNAHYDTASAAVNAAIATLAYPSGAYNVRCNISNDEKTIILIYALSNTNALTNADIYDVDWTGDTPVITFAQSVTFPATVNYSSFCDGVRIANDRSYFLYTCPAGSGVGAGNSYVYIWKTADTSQYLRYNGAPMLAGFSEGHLDEETSTLYTSQMNNSNQYLDVGPYKFTFNVGESGITAVSGGLVPLPTSDTSSGGSAVCVIFPWLNLFMLCRNVMSPNFNSGDSSHKCEIMFVHCDDTTNILTSYYTGDLAAVVNATSLSTPTYGYNYGSPISIKPKSASAPRVAGWVNTDTPDVYRLVTTNDFDLQIFYNKSTGQFTNNETTTRVNIIQDGRIGTYGDVCFLSSDGKVLEYHLCNQYGAANKVSDDMVVTKIIVSDGLNKREFTTPVISSASNRGYSAWSIKQTYTELPAPEE